MATCGISAGANVVLDAFKKSLKAHGIDDVLVEPAGCIGLCVYEPIVEVFEQGKEKVSYVHVSPKKAEEIVEKHLIGGKPVTAYGLEGMDIYDDNGELCRHFDDLPFYKKQKRLVLHNCGYINPEDIEEYIAVDGYQALAKVLTKMCIRDRDKRTPSWLQKNTRMLKSDRHFAHGVYPITAFYMYGITCRIELQPVPLLQVLIK